jgi:ABC-type spermidine/putrescine transport system permease subunit II
MTPEINAVSTIIFIFSLAMIVLWHRLRMRTGEDVSDLISVATEEIS